jgi:hypothetical protein
MPKQAPSVTLDPNSRVFKTLDAAADAVSKDYGKVSNERAAVLIKRPDGTYGYSTTVDQQDEGFALRALLAKGYSLAGIVHSHPGSDDRGQVFSTDDLNTAKTLGVPSYVRFQKDNSIRQYIPGKTATQKTTMSGDKFGVNTAIGDPLALEPEPAPNQPAQVSQTAAPIVPPTVTTAPAPVPGTTAAIIGDVARRDDPVTQY